MNRRTVQTAAAAAACAGLGLGLVSVPAQAASPRARTTAQQPSPRQPGPHATAIAADQKTGPRATAIAAADRAVASGIDRIVKDTDEAYVRTRVTGWVKNLFSVAYERTYKGLDVVGGDAVVLVDGTGAVRATNSATPTTISVPTSPRVTAATARRTAERELTTVSEVHSTRRIVWLQGHEQHLAYEVDLTGRTTGRPSHLHVYVDARTGAVLDTFDEVAEGSGQGAWNGPNPLPIDTASAGGRYRMSDPTRPGVACADYRSGSVFTSTTNSFGTGDARSTETGCVDALYDTQREWDMLRSWLGRNGLDGNGHGWPVRVGLNQVNAFWDGSTVSIGHNTRNQWVSSMDVVGHENGHGIDTYTPGGANHENGLGEATGDIFGALTEAYANQPSPYDTPDFVVGEEIDLVGQGPIRSMDDPASLGDPGCYSSAIPTTEVHSAAGPMNHWFYLLAEGSNPGGGKPSSPTCNSSTVTGVGIRDAGRIFYGAMLLKTSGFTYRRYRSATLTAAKNLDPSCRLFDRTRAAWDAISVPAQPADPRCSSGSTGDFSMSVTPTGGTVAAGRSATATVATTASGTRQQVSLAASGAPSGVTVDLSPSTVRSGGSSTMTVRVGGAVPAGRYPVTITGTGSVRHTVTYVLDVSGGGGGSCRADLIANGGFESGTTGWSVNSADIVTSSRSQTPRSGTRYAWFDGYGSRTTNTAAQRVTVPAECTTATLTYYLHVDTAETTRSYRYDRFTVQVNGATVSSASNLDARPGYRRRTVDLGRYAGSTITLVLTGVEDGSQYTSFVVDDVSLAGA